MSQLSAEDQGRVDALVAAFERIFVERMAGLPIVNSNLSVAAVGFRRHDEAGVLAGVLVTPWFINLMFLPLEPARWSGSEVGGRSRVAMPCGEIKVMVGEEGSIGRYAACSLYSPVQNFSDQDRAVETAQAAAAELFTFRHPEHEAPPLLASRGVLPVMPGSVA